MTEETKNCEKKEEKNCSHLDRKYVTLYILFHQSEKIVRKYSKTCPLLTPAIILKFVHKRQVSVQQRNVHITYKHKITGSL